MPTTAVTIAVQDAEGQVWFNGSWNVTLYSPQGIPGPPYNQLGTLIPVPNQSQSGSLNNLGQATLNLTPNSQIAPAGTLWMFEVIPATQPAPGFFQAFTVNTGPTQTINFTPPAIRIPGRNPFPVTMAYRDAEVIFGLPGLTYFNLTDTFLHLCTAVNPVTGVCTFTVVNTEPQPFDIAYYLVGQPLSSYEILRIPMDRQVTFPQNLPGSQAVCEIAPTGAVQLQLNQLPAGGGSNAIGTVNFAASAKTATFTFPSTVVFNAGDVIQVVAPATVDATFASIGGMFACLR